MRTAILLSHVLLQLYPISPRFSGCCCCSKRLIAFPLITGKDLPISCRIFIGLLILASRMDWVLNIFKFNVVLTVHRR